VERAVVQVAAAQVPTDKKQLSLAVAVVAAVDEEFTEQTFFYFSGKL
jgi:hypothetical protein